MAKIKEKLVIVSYHNTTPFMAVLNDEKYQDLFDIVLATPSNCARLYQEGQADLALVPVGALPDLQAFEVITDYCIGCNGKVYSVAMFSNQPIEECTHIYMDMDSLTSVKLARIVLEEHFKLDLTEISGIPKGKKDEAKAAYLMIGDKVFENESDFAYKYDLGELWKAMTGLPFAFAVWIRRIGSNENVEPLLNEIFEHGLSLCQNDTDTFTWEKMTLKEYLTDYISFDFNAEKKQAKALFLSKVAALELIS